MDTRKTIIMADTDITNMSVVESALSDTYIVFTATSAKKLFELLKTVSPDLILLGVEMPDMDGYKIIEKLKDTRRTANIPVILLAPSIVPAGVAKGVALGAVDYVAKPLSLRNLFKHIETHLVGIRKSDPAPNQQ